METYLYSDESDVIVLDNSSLYHPSTGFINFAKVHCDLDAKGSHHLSTRPARNGEAVARWVYDMAKKKQASNINNNSNTQHRDNIECDLKYRL